MRTHHPIQWFEATGWHDMLVDGRLWAILGIIGFIGLFTWLVLMALETGSKPEPLPYQGPFPYGPVPLP